MKLTSTSLISTALLLIGLTGCAVKPQDPTWNPKFDRAYQISQQQRNAHKETKEYQDYERYFLKVLNGGFIQLAKKCFPMGDREAMVLTRNQWGVIESVTPEHFNAKTRCFTRAFLGQQHKEPPFAPYYHYMEMN